MSSSGISVSSLFNNIIPGFQNTQLIQQEFQQLEEDLQSANLSGAQADFAALDRLLPQLTSAVQGPSNSLLGQALDQLSQDLHSGSLSAAQQDYSTIKQYFQVAGIAVAPSYLSGGGGIRSELQQLCSEIGKNCWALISRPQILSIIEGAKQASQEWAGSYSAQDSLRTRSNNFSVLG